jgi:NAD(P) transhydrogenase subunit beta
MEMLIILAYIAAAVMFILGIKKLSHESTARNGNRLSAGGMTVAIVATLLNWAEISPTGYVIIAVAALIGAGIGATAATRVQMTSMPEFVALFNGFGGMASLLVGCAEYWRQFVATTSTLEGAALVIVSLAIYMAILIGGVTFSGSLIAYGKLSERIDGKPYLFKGQQIVNSAVLLGLVVCLGLFISNPAVFGWLLIPALILAFTLGVMGTIPIGGADMPVVIALLNSYSGLAACSAGFVIGNTVLIVSGALVGASGLILTIIMCKAMNRSLANVLFSGFGAVDTAAAGASAAQGEAKALTPEDAYYVLEAAASVVFVPGYGMAVAQAQHVVRELGDILEANGAEVRYAIHPVAGRMPGHMNVLLAEADVPYEQLVEPGDVNPQMEMVDVAIVIGANDVVNPDARSNESSPIYGMPIIDVDRARTCFVLKRSMRSGFAGVENPLFFCPNTRMIFGDAKATMQALVAQFKED